MAHIAEGDVALQFAARLWKCDATSLQLALCVRTVRASSDTVRGTTVLTVLLQCVAVCCSVLQCVTGHETSGARKQ